MRVTQRSSRKATARHNDRSFLEGRSKEQRQEMAPHIDPERMAQNRVIGSADGQTLEEKELAFYERRYGALIEERNRRYLERGHPKKCRTVEEVYRSQRHRPEEVILQIGDRTEHPDGALFEACVRDYVRTLHEWDQAHGHHMHILDLAIHLDEATPHAHLRRVWDYEDERTGLPAIGQGRALEQAGIALPDPSRPEGRYNSRKMTFDAFFRERWQEICREHGLEIETEPLPRRKHLEKADYIAQKRQEELRAMEKALEEKRPFLEALEGIDERIADHEEREREAFVSCQELIEKREALTLEADARAEVLDGLQSEVSAAQDALIQLQADVVMAEKRKAKALEAAQEADREAEKARADISKAEELQKAVRDLESRRRVLSPAEQDAEKLEARAKPSRLDRSKVIVDKGLYEQLAYTAAEADSTERELARHRSALKATKAELQTLKGKPRTMGDVLDRHLEEVREEKPARVLEKLRAMGHGSLVAEAERALKAGARKLVRSRDDDERER